MKSTLVLLYTEITFSLGMFFIQIVAESTQLLDGGHMKRNILKERPPLKYDVVGFTQERDGRPFGLSYFTF